MIFVCDRCDEKSLAKLYICGWYKLAKIYRKVFFPSLFLEGNICARTTDAVLLREDDWILTDALAVKGNWDFKDKLYRVIEDDADGYADCVRMMERTFKNAVPIGYDRVDSGMNKGKIRQAALHQSLLAKKKLSAREATKLQYDYCIKQCMSLAQKLMNDRCESIGDIKALREYAMMAVTFCANSPDGYYYKAMAEEQSGFVKEGLRSINRALRLEPDGADIMALKANLLADLGNHEEACDLYQESYDISGDESYLLMKGRVLFGMGNVDAAYKVFREMKNRQLLEDAGINLKDMEHRWPFVAIRGLKNLLKKS